MKKLLLLTVAVAFVAGAANAADLKQYVSLKGNYAKIKNTIKSDDKSKWDDKVFGGSLAYGLKMGDVRAELEGTLNRSAEDKEVDGDETTKVKTDVKALMLNGYYDIPTGTAFTPYVGAGVGVARLKTTVKDQDDEGAFKDKLSATNLAYQLGAGVAYELTENWALDLGYRYADYGSYKKAFDGDDYKSKFSVQSHNVYFGARYTF